MPDASGRTRDGTAFEVHGPDGAPVVVLIHGLGLCRAIWQPQIAAYAQHYQVIAYDLYGHGDSAPLPGTGSLIAYSNQIAGLMDHIGAAHAALVGFSIGGMINRRFALDHPGRLTALAILNSPHDRGADGQAAVEARARSVKDQGALSTMDAALVRWFTPEFREARADALELVAEWRLRADPESYAEAAWVLAHGVRELIAPNPPITVPTFVMTCENDTGSTPDMSRAIASEIAGAELLIEPHLQHLGMMERPGAFSDPVLAFLDRVLL